ncbi:MAG: 23S rRNA (guanosine(2251)-2'-O)-methyltransferase RlmB [Flavobacteriaceae bacterium]|nr:23S rRNA (guanosine(2251)-2'-O)-methyltransferase RlmB [Flavobacteriaceae bacterium]
MKTEQDIYGIRAILEAITKEKTIDKIWLLKGQKGTLFKSLEKKIHELGISHSYVPKERLDRFSNQNHQGAVARIAPVQFQLLEDLIEQNEGENVTYLLLDGITDSRNLGAILRTAAATSVAGIILPQTGSAPVNADTVKTSAGGIFSVPIVKVNHLKDAIYFLQANNIATVAISEKASDTVFEHSFNRSNALIMGSEDKGIQSGIMKLVTARVKLPMSAQMPSLNVSVACGIVLFEMLRQRRYS